MGDATRPTIDRTITMTASHQAQPRTWRRPPPTPLDESFRKENPRPGEAAPGWKRTEGETPSVVRRTSNHSRRRHRGRHHGRGHSRGHRCRGLPDDSQDPTDEAQDEADEESAKADDAE